MCLLLLLLLPGLAAAENLHERSHRLLQFDGPPAREQVLELLNRGAVILGYVPEHGLVVSVPADMRFEGLGLAWYGPLEPAGKVSPEFRQDGSKPKAHQTAGEGDFTLDEIWLVEFHRDVLEERTRAIIAGAGLSVMEHSGLLPAQLLVRGEKRRLLSLAGLDEVSYMFPASADLVEGNPVVACAGAATEFGPVARYTARMGEGWDGPGRGSAEIGYHFASLSAQLPEGQQREEFAKALAEWERQAALRFVPVGDAAARRSITVLFARREHGDPYPFDGPGRTLAHTFYPPPNPEPIAGDMHFDDDEKWKTGADIDLYSVMLHELGHALGLGHSDRPGTVMYPYYRRLQKLTPEDTAALLEMYASRDGAPPPPPSPPASPPLQVSINPLKETVTAASTVVLAGRFAGGAAPVAVSWSSDRGPQGKATVRESDWSIPLVPLWTGANKIMVTATDAKGSSAAASVTVTRIDATTGGPDRTAPSLTITYPGSASLLTTSDRITLRGTARDDTGVVAVTWSSYAGSGTAQGTDLWTCADVPLFKGANTITIRAKDAAGNTAWRAVSITRR